MKALRKRWKEFTDKFGVNTYDSDMLFKELEQRYTEPKRFYHTLYGHIGACLREYDSVKKIVGESLIVETALWLHDTIYDSRAGENEARSAEWAAYFLSKFIPDLNLINEAVALIVFTDYSRDPETFEAKLLSDIDKSILGKPPKIFLRYNNNIRQEYSWVVPEIYRARRAGILKKFMDRPDIFFLPIFKEKYEANARKNMEAVIADLLKQPI